MKERVAQPVAPLDKIEDCIYVLRGQKVILDCDLTKLYGVPTKRLNEQVRRNRSKFPEDFLCRLTQEEFEELLRSRPEIVSSSRAGEGMRPQNATSRGHGGRRYLPYAFTEYGALQAANVSHAYFILPARRVVWRGLSSNGPESGFSLKAQAPSPMPSYWPCF